MDMCNCGEIFIIIVINQFISLKKKKEKLMYIIGKLKIGLEIRVYFIGYLIATLIKLHKKNYFFINKAKKKKNNNNRKYLNKWFCYPKI